MNDEDPYAELKLHFSRDKDVVVNSGRGAQGIKYNGKMFIMFYKGDLVVKLAPDRIKELINGNIGEPFDPGTGKPMKDRMLLRVSKKDHWIRISEESKKFVIG
jgi:hypothetical protein